METIAIGNQKGGSGKTTLTVNLAHALTLRGKQVVIIDLDPQAGASEWCGFRQSDSDVPRGEFLSDCLLKGKPLLGELVEATGKGFNIIPNSKDFTQFNMVAPSKVGHERMLDKALQVLAPAGVDFVLLDTPPTLSPIVTNAFTAADFYLLAVEPQASNSEPVDDAQELAQQVKELLNSKLELLGVVLGKFNKQRIQDRTILGEMEDTFGDAVCKTQIRISTRVGESFRAQETIHEYDAKGGCAADFMELADELLGRLEKPATKRGKANG